MKDNQFHLFKLQNSVLEKFPLTAKKMFKRRNKMRLSNIYILIFVLIAIVLPVSCADIETETSEYATMRINLDDLSHRKTARSRFATETMTTSEAKTILAVLMS